MTRVHSYQGRDGSDVLQTSLRRAATMGWETILDELMESKSNNIVFGDGSNAREMVIGSSIEYRQLVASKFAEEMDQMTNHRGLLIYTRERKGLLIHMTSLFALLPGMMEKMEMHHRRQRQRLT